MALRYNVPVGDIRPCADGDLVRPSAMRTSMPVEFRRGSDMAAVVAEVTSKKNVVLDAAVGSGKSTIFPAVLSRLARTIVLHVVPNPLLAADLSMYVRDRQNADKQGVKVMLWQAGSKMPSEGLVFISSSQLVAYLVAEQSKTALKGTTVFLDEAHESDACTYLVKNLSLQVGADRLILASATFGPSKFRRRETPGQLNKSVFSKHESCDTWDIYDASKPWGYANITDTSLIFVDSKKCAERLSDAYSGVGISVFRLHSRMPVTEFVETMEKIRSAEVLVVVLADYSFRSGFTFEASRIIDTGEVMFFDSTPGKVQKVSRLACQFELEQAAGRVGRVTTGKVDYFLPDADFPYKIYDLEGTEREAAAYLSRCMGFSAIGVLSAAIMAAQDLPQDVALSNAINALYPLTYYVVDSTGRSRSPSPANSNTSVPVENEFVNKPAYVDTEEYKMFIQSLYGSETHGVECGAYCYPEGLKADTHLSYVFPKGVDSVIGMTSSSNASFRIAGLGRRDRDIALTLVATRYNLLNVEHEATSKAIGYAGKASLTQQDRVTVMNMFEQLGEVESMRKVCFEAMDMIAEGYYRLTEISRLSESVTRRYEERIAELELQDADNRASFESHLNAQGEEFISKTVYPKGLEARKRELRRDKIGKPIGSDVKKKKKLVEFVVTSAPVTLGVGAVVPDRKDFP